jgi:hypothetical protein
MHDDAEQGKDWNEGHPDHEGEMAVSQLHRIFEMSDMLLDIIGENDELPGWIQYKITRAYSDLSDAFGYIESKNHMSYEEPHQSSLPVSLEKDEDMSEGKKKGLWANIHARRKAGKKPRQPGEKGFPKTLKIDEAMLRQIIKQVMDDC